MRGTHLLLGMRGLACRSILQLHSKAQNLVQKIIEMPLNPGRTMTSGMNGALEGQPFTAVFMTNEFMPDLVIWESQIVPKMIHDSLITISTVQMVNISRIP